MTLPSKNLFGSSRYDRNLLYGKTVLVMDLDGNEHMRVVMDGYMAVGKVLKDLYVRVENGESFVFEVLDESSGDSEDTE